MPHAGSVEIKSRHASGQGRAVLILRVDIGISYVVAELSSDQTSADAIIVPNVPNTIYHYSPVKTVQVPLDKGEGIVKRFSCGGT